MTANPSTFYNLDEAIRKLERFCSYQDRCHKEVEAKLRELSLIPEVRAKIIAHLIERDFLNEERFALNFVRGKFNQKNWGRIRLRSELRFRGITAYLVDKSIASIDNAEYHQKLDQLARRQWQNIKVPNAQLKKRKLYDYLFYRGWEKDLVYDKIRELQTE